MSWTLRYSTTNPYSTLLLFKSFIQKRNWPSSEIMKRKSPKAARRYLHVEAGGSCDSPLIGRMSTGTCLTGGVPRCYRVGAAALRRVAVRRRTKSSRPSSYRRSARHVLSCLSWQLDMPPSAVYDVTGPSSLLRLNNQLFISSQFPRAHLTQRSSSQHHVRGEECKQKVSIRFRIPA